MLLGHVYIHTTRKCHPLNIYMQALLQPEDVSFYSDTSDFEFLGITSAHIGYLVPLAKIADFLRAGVEVRFIFITRVLLDAILIYGDQQELS
jgi:hypothetical protein